MRFENLIPVLDVRDVDTSIEFYVDALGFRLHEKVEWAGKTEWALLRHDEVQLMLSAGRESEIDHEEYSQISEGVFFVYTDNLDALHAFLGAKGYAVLPSVLEANYRGRDFYVRDPDGYVLWFSGGEHEPSNDGARDKTRTLHINGVGSPV